MKDKGKLILTIIVSILTLISIIIIFNSKKYEYTIKGYLVDDKSPDRILKVYKEGKEVEFLEIRYKDDVLLCTSKVPAVYYGDIKDVKELKVILKNEKEVVAKIEEVE